MGGGYAPRRPSGPRGAAPPESGPNTTVPGTVKRVLPEEAKNGQGRCVSDAMAKKRGKGKGKGKGGRPGIGEGEGDARGKGAGSGKRPEGIGS